MSDWLSHVTIAAPRNGTTTHTVSPSSGTVVAGTPFTPTAGRLFVCFPEGAVTSTTPTGWTLPIGGSAINNTGLYAWYRVAGTGGTTNDTVVTTHNGSSYPVIFDFYEFAAGTTFTKVASATAVSNAGGAGPSLTGLTGTNWIAGVVAEGVNNAAARSVTWSAGTKLVDTYTAFSSTDGYAYSLTEFNADTSTSKSAAATITNASSTVERLMFAVTPAAGGTTPKPNFFPFL